MVETCQFHQYIGDTLPVPPALMVETYVTMSAAPIIGHDAMFSVYSFGTFFHCYNNFRKEEGGREGFLLFNNHAELLLNGCFIIKDDISHVVGKSAKVMALKI